MKPRLLILCATIIVTAMIGCGRELRPGSEIAVITVDQSNPTLAYAAEELRRHIEATRSLEVVEAAAPNEKVSWQFQLTIDPSVPPTCFSVSSATPRLVKLSGPDAACVLHAVYTMLEHAGIRFDIMGPLYPGRLELDRLEGWSTVVKPVVKRRGIRQHINFVMDISSYPLAEAREYIKNLARLRFNHIAFHSYKGQWYPAKLSKEEILAGGFFYGQRHDIPDHPSIKKHIRNRKTFCIPEIEPYYDQPQERSRAAIEWLQAVMKQAKRAGMTISFSMEPPGESVEDGVAACQAIIATYPLIDTLELITSECGGFKDEKITAQQARELVEKYFGPEALKDPEVTSAIDDTRGQQGTHHTEVVEKFAETASLVQLPLELKELSGNLKLVRELQKQSKHPALTLGVYATCHRTLRIAKALMRRFTPPDVGFTFLPSHGGRAAVESVRAMGMTESDWRRSMLYSWIEFDGNMYIQQNSVASTRQMVELGRKILKDEQIPGLAFNHWRTAENRTAIRYAAVACVEGPVAPEDFYRDYGRAHGIHKVDRFAAAMRDLDYVDSVARDELFNIGFCASGCWTGNPGMKWTRPWKTEDLKKAREGYRNVQQLLSESLPNIPHSPPVVPPFLDFLHRRLHCSDLHLQVIEQLMALRSLCDDKKPEVLADTRARQEVLDRCAAAAALAEEYLSAHALDIADRGCEGTLISYYMTIPVFIDKIRSVYGGVKTPPSNQKGEGLIQPAPAKEK